MAEPSSGPILWKLLRSLYELCQSPRLFHEPLELEMHKLGLKTLASDPRFLFKKHLYVVSYVDDLLIAGKKDTIQQFCVYHDA